MGTSSLHSDNPVLQSRRRRSFSLPSFRKSSGERPVKTNGEETARVRKAAAWQWYIRGVGEVVSSTKPARPVAPAVHVDDKCGVDGAKSMNNDNNKEGQAQKAALPINQPPQLRQRAASRFKTEAIAARPTASPLHGAASSPLYDEFELSGLRVQMADFVQRLQQKQQKAGQEESLQAAHAYGDQKSNKLPQPPAGVSTAACAGAIPAAASTHAFDRPLNALQRFLRKVISGAAFMKNTKKSPSTMQIPSQAVQEPFAPLDEEEDAAQYHYHHYIHHHHHHYHYGHSPEESAAITRRRRHSESSGMRPEIRLGPWEEVEEDSGGEEEEESPIQAYLARRRRYSDSFAGHYKIVKRGVAEEESRGRCMQQEGALLPELLQRRYNSERFLSTSPNKIPVVDERVSCKLGSKDEIDGERMQNITADIRSRRRHSADINVTDGASFNQKSVEDCRGGKTAGSTIYKLGGAHAGSHEGAPLPMAEALPRRHSETYSASFRRSEMNDHMRMSAVGRTPSPAVAASGRQYSEKPLQFPARPRTHATALPPI